MTGEDFYEDTEAYEGSVEYMYLDSRGFPTCGVGQLINSAEAAQALNWTIDGRDARADEIQHDWNHIVAMKDVEEVMKRRAARYYRGASVCRMSADEIKRVCVARLDDEFIPGLRKLVDGFDDLPEGAQRALVDMAYNLGLGGLHKFTHFLGAVRSSDWEAAAQQCHRATCRQDRNDWTAAQLQSCV